MMNNRKDGEPRDPGLTQFRQVLDGMKFPADKNQLVAYAKRRHAPSHVIDTLQQLATSEFGSPNADHMTEYNNLDELIREIKKIE